MIAHLNDSRDSAHLASQGRLLQRVAPLFSLPVLCAFFIAKYCTMLRNFRKFSQLPARLQSHFKPSLFPLHLPLPPPCLFSRSVPCPLSPAQIRLAWSGKSRPARQTATSYISQCFNHIKSIQSSNCCHL